MSQVNESVAIEALLNGLVEKLDSLDAHIVTYQGKARDALVHVDVLAKGTRGAV